MQQTELVATLPRFRVGSIDFAVAYRSHNGSSASMTKFSGVSIRYPAGGGGGGCLGSCVNSVPGGLALLQAADL